MASLPTRQRLLLVDDEEDILDELAELIESEGFSCLKALSVKQALQALIEYPDVALVLTDLRMPEESGLSLIKRLRAQRADLPVIVTSGHAEKEDVIDVLRLQVVDFFPKPIYHELLFKKLNDLFPQA